MEWVWQKKNWPNFEFDPTILAVSESIFIQNSGKLIGAIEHLTKENIDILKVELLSQEAISTSSIEGEILNRDSVQSSIKKHLGLKTNSKKIPPNAAGVSEMMVDVYLNFDKPLNHTTLFEWHKMLMNGRRDISSIGNYREHAEPMQIISGNLNNPKIFYEAPPSEKIRGQMEKFLYWYHEKLIDNSFPTLLFVSITHLFFEIIHPFEDGNGRIGRALVEKALSQRLKIPSLNSLASVIDKEKKEYYDAFQSCNTGLNINKYLTYFANLILKSQDHTLQVVNFIIFKHKFFIKFGNHFNKRQEKAILRIFEEGIEGFKGGLSAGNYKTITGTSNATATRDLSELLQIDALIKTGELKTSRYFLNMEI